MTRTTSVLAALGLLAASIAGGIAVSSAMSGSDEQQAAEQGDAIPVVLPVAAAEDLPDITEEAVGSEGGSGGGGGTSGGASGAAPSPVVGETVLPPAASAGERGVTTSEDIPARPDFVDPCVGPFPGGGLGGCGGAGATVLELPVGSGGGGETFEIESVAPGNDRSCPQPVPAGATRWVVRTTEPAYVNLQAYASTSPFAFSESAPTPTEEEVLRFRDDGVPGGAECFDLVFPPGSGRYRFIVQASGAVSWLDGPLDDRTEFEYAIADKRLRPPVQFSTDGPLRVTAVIPLRDRVEYFWLSPGREPPGTTCSGVGFDFGSVGEGTRSDTPVIEVPEETRTADGYTYDPSWSHVIEVPYEHRIRQNEVLFLCVRWRDETPVETERWEVRPPSLNSWTATVAAVRYPSSRGAADLQVQVGAPPQGLFGIRLPGGSGFDAPVGPASGSPVTQFEEVGNRASRPSEYAVADGDRWLLPVKMTLSPSRTVHYARQYALPLQLSPCDEAGRCRLRFEEEFRFLVPERDRRLCGPGSDACDDPAGRLGTVTIRIVSQFTPPSDGVLPANDWTFSVTAF